MNSTTHATTLVATAAFALTAAASAGTYDPSLDHTISINDGFQFDAGNSPTSFTVNVPDTGTVVGFSFEGDWSITSGGLPEPPTLSQLTITSPNGADWSIGGGFDFDAEWDFDVTGMHVAHGPDLSLPDAASEGAWEFTFQRVGGSGSAVHHWTNATITLHSIPAPGAMALLGLAGLVGRRRSRA